MECCCGFTCGTKEAFERHAGRFEKDTHRLMAPKSAATKAPSTRDHKLPYLLGTTTPSSAIVSDVLQNFQRTEVPVHATTIATSMPMPMAMPFAEKTFTFQPGKIGAYLDSDGVVEAIDGQANILGVECVMRFTKLDGNPITAKDLIAAARGNVPYQV